MGELIQSKEGRMFAMKQGVNRRSFLKGTAVASIAAAFQGLRPRTAASQPIVGPYDPLVPATDQTTGLNLINLPDGFTYKTSGFTGDVMGDGVVTRL